jgi:type IV secretion system protein VirB5
MRFRIVILGLFVAMFGVATPALAQVPVIDPSAIAQLVQQLATTKQELQEAISQYQEAKATFQTLSQDVNPNQWGQELEQPLMQDSMPNTTLLPGMLAGISPPSDLSGNFGSLAQQYLGQNQVYAPQGQDFQATQMRSSENSIAEIEAVATQNLQSLQAREQEIPQIQDQLTGATTIQQVSAIQARLSAEQNYAQAQTAQAANLQVLAEEQQQAQQEANEEDYRQNLDQTLQANCQQLASEGQTDSVCSQ